MTENLFPVGLLRDVVFRGSCLLDKQDATGRASVPGGTDKADFQAIPVGARVIL